MQMQDRAVSVAVEIPVTEILVDIEGTSSLIVHRFDQKMRDEIAAKQQGKQVDSKKKRIRNPEAEFEGAKYVFTDPSTGEVKDGFPAVGLKKSMIDAGYRFLGRAKTDTRADIQIPVEYLTIDGPPATLREDVVRLSGMGRTADLRYRPEYMPWSMRVPLIYNHERVSQEHVLSMLAHAGFAIGLGEWRPERDGDHGRFNVVSVTGSAA